MAERDMNGKFAKGNAGGPGRPRRQIEQDYLAAFSEAITLDDWKEIIEKAVGQAKEGDARARQWLTHYVIGPRQDKELEIIAIQEELEIDPIARQVEEQKLYDQLAPPSFRSIVPTRAKGRARS